jgi:hypothetical protein
MSQSRVWAFQCPECGFGHVELGWLGTDHEVYCLVCSEQRGVNVRVQRWLAEQPQNQARLREVLAA